MTSLPRWFTDTDEGHSQAYVDQMRSLAAEGEDLAGEARLVDAMVRPRSRILDAGCGPGRVGAALFARGHNVVGVDVDPELIAAAREDHPGPAWLMADLASLDLASMGEPEPFDAIVVAGNVLAFVAPDTEVQVLKRLAAHLVPGGFVIAGFHTERYDIAEFDRHLAKAGFVLEQRFATWDLRPWQMDADFAVSVLRFV
jgi:SAM-dependent methyltransferase